MFCGIDHKLPIHYPLTDQRSNFMENFIRRLTIRSWLFAISIYVFNYMIGMVSVYQEEAEKIREKSLETFGGDITPQLGFSEILKSAGWDYAPSWGLFVTVGSYLVVFAYFKDYKSEQNEGLKRVFIAGQILFPILFFFMVWFSGGSADFKPKLAGAFLWLIDQFIYYFGIGEAVVLILIQLIRWIREGFAEKSKHNQ